MYLILEAGHNNLFLVVGRGPKRPESLGTPLLCAQVWASQEVLPPIAEFITDLGNRFYLPQGPGSLW